MAISNAPVIAGIDEAGRGALAGPVVAAACAITIPIFRIYSRGFWSPTARTGKVRITDSKQLNPEERALSFAWILANLPIGIGIVDQSVIDQKGILRANELAMRRALAQLRSHTHIDSLLIDGRDAYTFDLPHTSIIRGDASECSIAAASIVAKVTRDTLMRRADSIFPGYGFAEHKGYGTEPHRTGLRKLGPCVLHRRDFVRTFLTEQLSLIA